MQQFEEEEVCEVCSKPLRKTCHDADECSTCGTSCAECSITMCCDCIGETCGYCSDPAGRKKYYCDEHVEPKCVACNNIICEYCNTYPHWCEKSGCENPGPYHDSNYAGSRSCYGEHLCNHSESE